INFATNLSRHKLVHDMTNSNLLYHKLVHKDISNISDIESTDNSDDILDTSSTEDENNTDDIMDIEDANNIENSENIEVANTMNIITKMQSSYNLATDYIEEKKIENQVVARICKVEGCETIYSATTSTGILNKHLKNKHNIILNLKTNCLYLSQELYSKKDIKCKQECFNATVDLIIGA
ncbi:8843_t:CDS:2, partial [Cetraspora pellucida]